ncbi:MAG: efflux RND transporter permease subunit [Hyphomicrobiaceae bacterium]
MHPPINESLENRRFRFTFGLERLGLVALQAPRVTLALILLMSIASIFGVSKLTVDDSLSELFRTNTKEFRQYEAIAERFPSSEYDVLAVIEGDNLLTREGLVAFANVAIDLQLADGVDGLVSMLSARGAPDDSGYAAPVVPDELPDDDAAFEQILEKLRSNEIVKGKFLSDDGRLALIVMALDHDVMRANGSRAVITGLKEEIDTALEGSGLDAKLTGAPVMQLEIRNAVERDRLVYNGLGFVLGAATAFFFFRRLSLTLLAVLGPTIAIFWTLGVVGGLDFRLNLFINVLTPLILVAGFSDSMHLVFAIRRDVRAGIDRLTAARNAVKEVAPACLLTAMNAALALLSFALADSALIRTFGAAALLAVGISYIAVATVVPTLAVFLVRQEGNLHDEEDEDDNTAMGLLKTVTEAIVRRVAAAPTVWFCAGVLGVAVAGAMYIQLEPRYRLADQVPDKEQALAATAKLDQKLTGANPVHIMIEWGGDLDLYAPQTLQVIADAHSILEERAGLGNVWSLESLRRWLREAGDSSPQTIERYVEILPSHLRLRFIAKDNRAVLVTGRLPDVNASEVLPVIETIDLALQPVRDAFPEYTISVTGLSAIAARNSAKLISELNWGLIGDMFVIFVFLGLALRSVLAGVASVLPSLFPIFLTGSVLYATGNGLQFASIIAITVAFALAIDSTIHFLNRYHIEESRLGPAAGYQASLIASVHHIGPAIVLTTIVLALGLGVTMLSDLPSLRLFGRLTAVCLFASLIGQLIILPATIACYRRVFPMRL